MNNTEKYPNISIDTFDFVLIAAMFVGMYSDNWLPFMYFIFLFSIVAYIKN